MSYQIQPGDYARILIKKTETDSFFITLKILKIMGNKIETEKGIYPISRVRVVVSAEDIYNIIPNPSYKYDCPNSRFEETKQGD